MVRMTKIERLDYEIDRPAVKEILPGIIQAGEYQAKGRLEMQEGIGVKKIVNI